MATMQYTVWTAAAEVAVGPVLQEGAVAISDTAAPSEAIIGQPNGERVKRRVRIMCDAKAWVTWGAGVTALNDGTEGRMMGAEIPEYFDIEAGHTISVIERL